MDGLAAVTARVAQIQGLVQGMQGAQAPTRAPVTTSPLVTTGSTVSPTAASTDFAAALQRARATGAPSGAAPAGSTAVDADGVPLELKRYGNGTVPASALQRIGDGDHRLWAPAADAFADLRAAARAAGVTIGVTDSYRSYEAQVDVAERKGLYKNGGLAAVPGTSDHGWGLSLDLDLDSRAQTWMRANAGRFGFDENTPREPWHWTYQPHLR